MDEDRAQSPHRLQRTFRALRGRNFRLWYIGQGVSLVGTFLQQTALSWYLYRTTNSPFVLGLAGFANQVPTLVATPFAGVIADRIRRKNGLLATQALMMVQAAIVAGLVIAGRAQTWAVVLLSALLGLVMAFDIPIRQAFMSEVVADANDLPNAIALNSALFNAARFAGPAAGGLAVAAIGEGPCLLLNAASFLAVLASLLAIRTSAPRRSSAGGSLSGDFAEGVRGAWTSPVIRPVLGLVAALSVSGLAMLPLVPAIARDTLGGGARTLGFLMASVGAGATVSALQLAGRTNLARFPTRAGLAAILSGACVAALGLPLPAPLVHLAMFGAGYGFIQISSGSNSLLQSIVPERFRGRIVSLFAIAFLGTTPFGSLFLGWLADGLGLDAALFVAGGASLVAGTAFLARSRSIENELRAAPTPVGRE